MIIATSSSATLAQSVAKRTKIPLMKIKRGTFPGGELYYRLMYAKRPAYAYIIGSVTHDPASIFELMCLAEAAQQNGIALKAAIIPYFAYGRQDDIYEAGEPVMAECIANALMRIPAVRFEFITLHSDKLRDYLGPHDEISGLEFIKKKIKFDQYSTIIAPDEGAHNRAKSLANPKQRVLVLPKDRKEKVKIIRPKMILPDLTGQRVLIIDDIIDTGKTVMTAVQQLKKSGVKQIDVAAVHAAWSHDAKRLLHEPLISKIYLTNTVKVKKHPKMTIFDISEEIASRLSGL